VREIEFVEDRAIERLSGRDDSRVLLAHEHEVAAADGVILGEFRAARD
jgi:hypothetical protein